MGAKPPYVLPFHEGRGCNIYYNERCVGAGAGVRALGGRGWVMFRIAGARAADRAGRPPLLSRGETRNKVARRTKVPLRLGLGLGCAGRGRAQPPPPWCARRRYRIIYLRTQKVASTTTMAFFGNCEEEPGRPTCLSRVRAGYAVAVPAARRPLPACAAACLLYPCVPLLGCVCMKAERCSNRPPTARPAAGGGGRAAAAAHVAQLLCVWLVAQPLAPRRVQLPVPAARGEGRAALRPHHLGLLLPGGAGTQRGRAPPCGAWLCTHSTSWVGTPRQRWWEAARRTVCHGGQAPGAGARPLCCRPACCPACAGPAGFRRPLPRAPRLLPALQPELHVVPRGERALVPPLRQRAEAFCELLPL